MEQIQDCTWFTKLDLKNSFNWIWDKEGDEWKTLSKTRYGMYEYKVMPFGLANAPSSFRQYVNNVWKEHIDKCVVVNIDDILIYATSKRELIQLTTQVLTKLKENSLCVNGKTCVFRQHEVEFVGFAIGHNGIKMSVNKVKDIIEWKEPRSVHEVQQVLRFANFYRRFIQSYSGVARPLLNLTKKRQPWNWTNEC